MGALSIVGVSKAYKLYASQFSRLKEWLLPGSNSNHTLTWVLKDITFAVDTGGSMGILGRNGAGKSTLLKIIAGTTQPTEGTMSVIGRVAALLELGMGFHPDFTGRQNVFMSGQLQGLSGGEVRNVMPQIEAFADIGDYLDQPVRIYSSGMQMRLAFAVATAVRPDILIVDEALAVGDAAFQRKCYQRIEAFRNDGTSLLFVSHDIEAVKRLCSSAIFLNKGLVEMMGTAKDVCDLYERHLFGTSVLKSKGEQTPHAYLDSSLDSTSSEKQYGDGGASIEAVELATETGDSYNVFHEGVSFIISYTAVFRRRAEGVKFGMLIKTVDGISVYGTNTASLQYPDEFFPGDKVLVRFLLDGNLVAGTYYLNVGSTHKTQDGERVLHRRVDCLIFRITPVRGGGSIGYANLFAEVSVTLCRP